MRTNFISLGRSAPTTPDWHQSASVNTGVTSEQWGEMLWYFDTHGEWRLETRGLSIHDKELGLHTHLDQRVHSSYKTPLPCSPLSFHLYSEGDKHYINTEIVWIISRCESCNKSYIRNEGDTHMSVSLDLRFIYFCVSTYVSWSGMVCPDRDRIVCLMRISAQWIWKEDMTVKSDLLTNIQIFVPQLRCLEWCRENGTDNIYVVSRNGRPRHKMKPSLLAASRNPISFNHLWNQNPKYGQ